MEAAAIVLALAGLVAGLTGTWSPCGFSMIDTLGPTGHDAGRRRTIAAVAAFALGAPIGGAITFGGLAALGGGMQSLPPGGAAIAVAVAIAVAAAALDGFGVPVAPQLRRQVPESWRRVLPLPVAGLLYGILLGLGFTTYVLAFALPALAAISLMVGDVALGLLLGVAFGIGRALPIVVLAPLADHELGARAITAMAERPALLRGARLADAAALAGVALILGLGHAPDARAAERVASPASDPSADGGALAFSLPGDRGALLRGEQVLGVGAEPALGGGRLAALNGDGTADVVDLRRDRVIATIRVGDADALAVSRHWLAWRVPRPDRLRVARIARPDAGARTVARIGGVGTLSRPALAGGRVAWAVATRGGSAIRARPLARRRAPVRTLRRAGRGVLLSAPSLRGRALLWVRTTDRRQRLLVGAANRPRSARALLTQRGQGRRDGGHEHGRTSQGVRPRDRGGPTRPASTILHTTALGRTHAYVVRLPRDGGAPVLVRVPR